MDTKYLKEIRKLGNHVMLKDKYNFGHSLEQKNFTCTNPYKSLSVTDKGLVYTCTCHGHLPYPVSHIFDLNQLEDVWETPVSKKLQENTKSGSTFKFCDLGQCAPNTEELGPYRFVLAIDESCNLQCPSCRLEINFLKEGPIFKRRLEYMKKFAELLSNFKKRTIVEIGGDGEPFASKVYGEFLYNYTPLETHFFSIRSNGTLIDQKKLLKSKVCQQISHFTISIDAGSEEVYNIVRPPGSWKNLHQNLNFLKDSGYNFHLNFVVQKNNYRDLINFVDVCNNYGVAGILMGVNDWGTWSKHDPKSGISFDAARKLFEEQQVFASTNALYYDWLSVCANFKLHPYKNNIRVADVRLNDLYE